MTNEIKITNLVEKIYLDLRVGKNLVGQDLEDLLSLIEIYIIEVKEEEAINKKLAGRIFILGYQLNKSIQNNEISDSHEI